MKDAPDDPRHFTREPWWVVLIATVVMALVPIWKYGRIQEINTLNVSLPVLILGSAGFGALASSLLVFRSHIRNPFWANCVLIAGIILIAVGVSLGILLLGK